MAELSANVRMIKGIGEQRAKALGKLGIVTLRDLIGWVPRRYQDRRSVKRIMDLIPGESACVAAMIASPPQLSHVRRGMDLVKVRAVDESGVLDVTFFNQTWLKNQLQQGETYLFYGKAEGSLLRKTMASPVVEPEGRCETTGRIVPIYPLAASPAPSVRAWMPAWIFCRIPCRIRSVRNTTCAASDMPMKTSIFQRMKRHWNSADGGWPLKSCSFSPLVLPICGGAERSSTSHPA